MEGRMNERMNGETKVKHTKYMPHAIPQCIPFHAKYIWERVDGIYLEDFNSIQLN